MWCRIISMVMLGFASLVCRAETALTAVPLPGGTSTVGSFTLASVYGQPCALNSLSAAAVVLDPGFICIEEQDISLTYDLDNDGYVGASDLVVLLTGWGSAGAWQPADINRDGIVDAADLSLLLMHWGSV